ncbi:transcriptional regulator [Nostoc linckia z18]|uniref:Transcriptional regulator n=2 Tax=Nostoc linckia TaxID=92942 RepID=A0A9Q5Z993_NOSLI|nr:type IV toxin-antitoxin system AbiEi family antitoxin domain-containing protein [Nostoc linckia]PHK39988.1 transcriptional regulator [Nostoc linckia z15]PHK44008.1 transcriptional regulator [Nostoc linckia z16]PHJ56864.1 transcriptional regulator [Nostoc linckia z1]PHJ58754.1 transcriptional regulator [Nostoc linckia z3]PHJ62562.1 transcriptional regulator [Nostoc linckia z2]
MTKMQQVLELAHNAGAIRAKDAEAKGIHRDYLKRLEQQGLLIRSARGIYTSTLAEITESHSLVEAVKRVPHGVICLLSALSFYELTTQAPFEVWLAIPQKARAPKEDILPLRIVYMSGKALESGIEEYEIEGVRVPVYCPAKTVVDCFKFRNKIGLDVALEALRECLKERRCTIDEIWHYAKICRMQNVMRPYLESLG